MTLPRDHDDVARPRHAQGGPDRGAPVELDPRCVAVGRHAFEHVTRNRARILGTRVVRGQDREVGKACGDRSHQRALRAIPIASAPEHDHELAAVDE